VSETRTSFCRACYAGCAIEVELDEEGRAARVVGDRANPMYQGYTCVKGRALPTLHNRPERLLHSLKRCADGGFEPIPVEQAMDEIAVRLQRILDECGPRSIAGYQGTMVGAHAATDPMYQAFMGQLEHD
jgi:anaerobic selenocysteine-containing dehydrogenase